jgi:phosphate-selective porin OprO/OprP
MNRQMTRRQAARRLTISAISVSILVVPLSAPAAVLDTQAAEPTRIAAPAIDAADPAVVPGDPVEEGRVGAAAEPKLVERVLRERQILGTRLRGNVFIDGLPVSPDQVQIGRALELRRARLSFSRQLARRWVAEGAVELASGRAELRDLYLRKNFDRLGAVTIGNQSEPMGLNELTSPLTQPLLEPSLATALVPGRNFGIAIGNRHDRLQYQAGVFGAGTQQEGRRDLGSAVTARLTHRVIDAFGEVRHVGLGFSHRELSSSEQFRSVPEVGVGQEQLVDTGVIDGSRKTLRASLEYIQTHGRWTVLGEVIGVRVSRDAASQLQFGGAYVEASWMAWGDGPRYADADAILSRSPVTSKATWGNAWGNGNLALTARLSRIDLSDDDIQGGTETNLTLGATWDLNQRTRLAANLVHFVELTGPNAAAESSLALAVRFQYAW